MTRWERQEIPVGPFKDVGFPNFVMESMLELEIFERKIAVGRTSPEESQDTGANFQNPLVLRGYEQHFCEEVFERIGFGKANSDAADGFGYHRRDLQ
jgi:hypothetical protein